MIDGGAELLAGVAQDPVFGPLVAFGPGRRAGRAHRRRAVPRSRRSPTSTPRSSSTAGKAGRLVAGFRGAPPADAAALADVLHRLSQLADDFPELAELDLNPVLGLPDRAVAVDARIRLARPTARTDAKSW